MQDSAMVRTLHRRSAEVPFQGRHRPSPPARPDTAIRRAADRGEGHHGEGDPGHRGRDHTRAGRGREVRDGEPSAGCGCGIEARVCGGEGKRVKELRYVRVINEALREEMCAAPRVCLVGEDSGRGEGAWSATRGLLEEFGPDRVKDMPIVENTIIGMALGMAMSGLRPVAEIMFMDFITVCMDQIVNGIAKKRYRFAGQFEVPVTIRTAAGAAGGAGPDHSQSFEAGVAHLPR